tara:strand:- start:701 stop:1135 length:435 start_codon:yes stop_codon:yes gene_type:complete
MYAEMFKEVGSLVARATSAFPQATTSSGTINGASHDRMPVTAASNGYHSAVFRLVRGTATGTITTGSIAGQLQDSPDGTTWSDVSGAAIAAFSTDNGSSELEVDLSARQRYVRMVWTADVTGSSTPTVFWSAEVLLGGKDRSIP